MPSIDHTGRRVLVTGGTSGIGRAVTERLVVEGALVWIVGTTADGVAAAVAATGAAGGTAADVSDEAAVVAAYDAMVAALGGVDAVFVNAGIDGLGVPATEIDAAHALRVMAVNVVGALLTAREAARRITDDGRNRIVFNASVNGLRPEANFADYNASKAAVISLAKTLALELAPRHIAVTAICPGYFPSRMTQPYLNDPHVRAEIEALIPAGRVGELGEVAGLVSFLLGPDAGFCTGGVYTVDGGRSV